MFKEIKGNQIVIMAKAISSDHYDEDGNFIEGKSMEETLENMELIDDLLVIMRSKALLNKKKGLKRLISGRIEMACNNNSIIPGSSNLQLNNI